MPVLIRRQSVLIRGFILERRSIYRKVMASRKTIAMGVVLVAVIGLGTGLILNNLLYSDPDQVPPPSDQPEEEPEIFFKDGLGAWANTTYWQDFMPEIPEEGPPFYTTVWVNVSNNGTITVNNFIAIQVTIYFYDTSCPLATLDLVSSVVYFIWPEIRPGESVVFEFTNSRSSIFSPAIDEGTELYSKVLTIWGNESEMCLTTPPSELLYNQ